MIPQAKALDAVIRRINSNYGPGALMKMNTTVKMERTPSGCLPLDVALGGGYPKGRIIEVRPGACFFQRAQDKL